MHWTQYKQRCCHPTPNSLIAAKKVFACCPFCLVWPTINITWFSWLHHMILQRQQMHRENQHICFDLSEIHHIVLNITMIWLWYESILIWHIEQQETANVLHTLFRRNAILLFTDIVAFVGWWAHCCLRNAYWLVTYWVFKILNILRQAIQQFLTNLDILSYPVEC